MKRILKIIGFIVITIFTAVMAINYPIWRGGLILLPLAYCAIWYAVTGLWQDWKQVLEDNKTFETKDDYYCKCFWEATGQDMEITLKGEAVDEQKEL